MKFPEGEEVWQYRSGNYAFIKKDGRYRCSNWEPDTYEFYEGYHHNHDHYKNLTIQLLKESAVKIRPFLSFKDYAKEVL